MIWGFSQWLLFFESVLTGRWISQEREVKVHNLKDFSTTKYIYFQSSKLIKVAFHITEK